MDGDFTFAPDGAFVLQKPVVCVPFSEYEQIFERIRILTDENKALRRQLVKLRRGSEPVDETPPGTLARSGSESPRLPTMNSPESRASRPRRRSLRRKEPRKRSRSSKRSSKPSPSRPFSFNAVQVTNRMAEVYCEKIETNTPLERRMPRIKKKLAAFMELFEECEIVDGKSQKVVVSAKDFPLRYECIFRESGANLELKVNKRFFFDGKETTYCMDFEHHESVVSPTPGTRADGSLGVLPPRSLDLIVLYEVGGSKIRRIWCMQDKERVGSDKTMDREKLLAHRSVRTLMQRVEECTPQVESHFHNYLEETVIG